VNIALDDLTPGLTLVNASGSSDGSPFITVVPANSSLAPGASANVTVQFQVPGNDGFAYDVRQAFQP
jgi:hypothetical protein